jgi:DNA-binding NarL/FixJ family response regulator
MFLEQAALTIRSWPEFELVGAVGPDMFLSSLLALQPHVAVLDPTSLDEEAQDAIFARASDGVRLLFLSNTATYESYEALERGAIGCLTKDVEPRELCDAVAAAARDDPYIATAAVSTIAAQLRLRNRIDQPHLSSRQLEILRLIAEGRTTKQVADQLGIASTTVKTHLRAIYRALGVRNRTQAVLEALRHELIH